MKGAKATETRATGSSAADNSNNETRRFFATKQILTFVATTLVLLMIDFVILLGVSVVEGVFSSPTESGTVSVRDLSSALVEEEGTWTLDNPEIAATLDEHNCWAALVLENGSVAWTRNAPDYLPRKFSRNDIAVLGHDRAYGDSTVFMWTKDSALVLLGYRDGSYVSWGMTLSSESLSRLPVYALLLFFTNLIAVFLLFVISQRSVVKNVGPLLDSLDELAQGKPTTVRSSGMLNIVGRRINKVSETLKRKEKARKNWVAGVSHDVRTPLAIAMGHAERLENDPALPEEARESAAIIVAQGSRIRDLVEDLNIATQLQYDMQPLRVDPINVPRMLRELVVDHLNQGFDGERLELSLDDAAGSLTMKGDERLLKRALRNAIGNACKHNAGTAHITLFLRTEQDSFSLGVSDDGRGMAPGQLASLAATLEEEYLGIGSLVENEPTKITLAPGRARRGETALAPTRDDGPEVPIEHDEVSYPSSFDPPVIASQEKPHVKTYTLKKGPAPLPPHDASHERIETPNTAEESLPAQAAQWSTSHSGTIEQHGLGIPLIARIAFVHGGSFSIETSQGNGFSLTISFPRSETPLL